MVKKKSLEAPCMKLVEYRHAAAVHLGCRYIWCCYELIVLFSDFGVNGSVSGGIPYPIIEQELHPSEVEGGC